MANYFDKYKNVKFNDIYIEDICEIQDISEPLLTSRTIDTLDIPSVDGEIFNGSKENSYKIEITVLIDCDTQEEYYQKLEELKDTFDVDEPKQFFKDKDKFILAIPDEEIEQLDKEALYSREFKISLFCPEPYYYSKDIKVFENEDSNVSSVIVENQGKKPVYPLISIGFTKDAYFAQVELKSTGQKILVGKYPKLSLGSQTHSNRVLYNNCESVSDFIDSSASIDSDRTGGGVLTLTNSGEGVCMSSPGTGETTWKGVCKRLNLSKEVDEFELSCNISHNSTGQSGDPTTFKTEVENIESGIKVTYYKVTSATLNYRTGPGTSYKKLGTLKKGFEIGRGTVTKGWLKFPYEKKHGDTSCYASTKYLTKILKNGTVTTTKKNFVTNQNTPIHTSAKYSSTKLATIPGATVVRCICSKRYKDIDSSGDTRYYYKMAKSYNGKIGYVCVGNLVEAGDAVVEYPESEDYETSDDKTGIIELYGFDTNGQRLFILGMYDDNEWYEHTYPKCKVGSRVVLKDNTLVPDPKKKYSANSGSDGTTIKVTNALSGGLGDWNEFWGTWTISRKIVNKKYQWNVEVKKIKDGKVVKTQRTLNIKYSDLPIEKLSYVVLYIGTTGTMEKTSGMALTHIQCYEINPTTEEEVNVAYFKQGDILEIDADNDGHNVYLNETERNDLIDVGSRFFSLGAGEEEITVYSNDNLINTSVAIREKY